MVIAPPTSDGRKQAFEFFRSRSSQQDESDESSSISGLYISPEIQTQPLTVIDVIAQLTVVAMELQLLQLVGEL